MDEETPQFDDRRQAGRVLARSLRHLAGDPSLLVLALPRGGVPVGFEVAQALGAPLDVLVVRKLGLPGQEELAIGAIASGGVRVLNEDVVSQLGIDEEVIDAVARREIEELASREARYRDGGPPFPDVSGRTVVLVDDGLATGSTMRAAVAALRASGPTRLVVAVPVSSFEAYQTLKRVADEMVCVLTPEPFIAVGLWYRDFSQTTDQEVRELLEASRRQRAEAERAEEETLAGTPPE